MENTDETLEQLKEILENIKYSIKIYNNLVPNQKLTLVEDKNDLVDINDIYICKYDDGDCVDFFKRITFDSDGTTGLIFKGLHSDNVGILLNTSSGNISWENRGYIVSLNNKKYVSNCEIRSFVRFDEMRLIMVKSKKLENYTPGFASEEEMLEVLKFTFSYYKLEKKHNIKTLFKKKVV